MSENVNSTWKWIGFGCGGCLLIIIAALVAAFFWGRGVVQSMEKGMTDPEVKAEGAKKVLGLDEIPEGQQPTFYFKMPFLFEAGMVSDQAFNPEEGGFYDTPKQFIFQTRMKKTMARDNDFEPLKENPPDWNTFAEKFGIRLNEQDYDGGGEIITADQTAVRWDRWTGDYNASGFQADLDGTSVVWRGICESGELIFGIWYKHWDHGIADTNQTNDVAATTDLSSTEDSETTKLTKTDIDAALEAWWGTFRQSSPCEGF